MGKISREQEIKLIIIGAIEMECFYSKQLIEEKDEYLNELNLKFLKKYEKIREHYEKSRVFE